MSGIRTRSPENFVLRLLVLPATAVIVLAVPPSLPPSARSVQEAPVPHFVLPTADVVLALSPDGHRPLLLRIVQPADCVVLETRIIRIAQGVPGLGRRVRRCQLAALISRRPTPAIPTMRPQALQRAPRWIALASIPPLSHPSRHHLVCWTRPR